MPLTQQALERDHHVTVLARDRAKAERLLPTSHDHLVVAEGDATDPEALGRAIAGIEAAAGVQHIVFSSVAGAEDNRIVPHHRIETHLIGSGIACTMLRPGFFAQNLTTAYRSEIRDHDRIQVPAGDGRVAFVDTRDLGELAAMVLVDPAPHAGRSYILTGPRAVTFAEVADRLTEALGRPIRYEPATVLGYLRHLCGRGLPVRPAE